MPEGWILLQSSLKSYLLRQRSWPLSAHFHQEGWGPPSIFGEWRVPCFRAGLLSRCPESPAWICAQGSIISNIPNNSQHKFLTDMCGELCLMFCAIIKHAFCISYFTELSLFLGLNRLHVTQRLTWLACQKSYIQLSQICCFDCLS